MSVAWLANGNPPSVTTYTVVLSTGSTYPNSFMDNVSLSTAPAGTVPAATLLNLKANTTYFLFIDARNWSGASSGYAALGSTSTLAAPPAASVSTFGAVGADGFAVFWSTNANGVSVTTYTVQVSTDGANFGGLSPYAASAATAPAGPYPQYRFSGLNANTTYFLRIRTEGNRNITDFVNLGSTSTLAMPPGSVAATFGFVNISSFTAFWSANGNGISVTTYTVQASTDSDNFNAAFSVTATTKPVGAVPQYTFSGLQANTTYFFQVNTLNHNSVGTSFVTLGATVTWATPPLPLANTFLSVQAATVTVAWAALPNDSNATTCEGYVLEISSTNFGALSPGGVINSSATTSVLASTLTVALPDVAVSTNYYRVASLNWSGSRSYLSIGKMNFQIEQSAVGIDLGAIDMTLVQSTVSVSSIVVTNVGDLPATYIVSGDMATVPSSSWTLTTVVGVDSVTLQGLWNSGPPAPAEGLFSTFITTAARISQVGGNYAGAFNGVAVPAGQSRTLWFRLQIPSSTSSNSPEVIGVQVRAVLP